MRKKLSLIFMFLWISACASSEKTTERLSFEGVRRIAAASREEGSIKSVLGDPDLVTRLPSGEVVWIYLNESRKSTRLSIVYQKDSNLAAEMNWFPRENEENDLAALSKIFKGSEFKPQALETTAHAISSESLMVDMRHGITVVYRPSSGKISSIGWDFKDPNRNPAQEK